MAVQWGLAADAPGPLDILQAAGQATLQKIQVQQAQRQNSQQQQAFAARPQAQQQLASGDYAGAQRTAVGAGDFDLASHIDTLSKEHKSELEQQAGVAGSLAYSLKGVPAEQRAAQFQASIPALKARGLDDEDIAHLGSDLSDNALNGYVSTAQSVTQQIADFNAREKANGPTTTERELIAAGIQPGTPQFREAMLGHVNPSQFMQVGSDATGHQVLQTRGMTDTAPSPTGQQIEQIVSQIAPGAQITSGVRTPEHNREVGGVPKSFHLTDQARDVVPPQGVSMEQFHAALKANMPGFDVINEGNHVHIEPSSRGAAPAGPRVVYSTPPKANGDAPSGYRYAAGGNLEPIPGGPADPAGAGNKNTTSNRKAEADFREKFNNLPEVKNFRVVRGQGHQIKQLAANPSGQNDIAMIFSYMKMLDPTSVVREGEFALAGQAAGLSTQIQNILRKADSGERLSPEQRVQIVKSANDIYTSARNIYNERAQEYRGYAIDNGVNANRVATTYSTPKKTTPAAGRKEIMPGVFIEPVH
jgi:hypothetical protein